MNNDELYAHTPNEEGQWHLLREHLLQVAELAAQFAKPFRAQSLAYILGLFHDLGKINQKFQAYLRACGRGKRCSIEPHAIWGAAFSVRYLRCYLPELMLPVHGHHAGLPDRGQAFLECDQFLAERRDAIEAMRDYIRRLGPLPQLRLAQNKNNTRREFFIRMLFSTLVDADYLDTEKHFARERAALRNGWLSLEELWRRLQESQVALLERVQNEGKANTPVNRARWEVYQACLQAASKPPGIFRLTVPTGGGKTRSGLAFALKHACEHGLRRVIVAVPYTSIVDQTAEEYEHIFGKKEWAFLEHHSAFEPPEGEEQGVDAQKRRLATENWDAPLILTTTVQLFESLFSDRPGKVRKLHRLAQSVLFLDEVQTLPPQLLRPTLDVLRTLVEEYGVSLILSTATQPAFEESRFLESFQGLNICEIVPDAERHFETLRRVTYALRTEPITWRDLATEVRDLPQVMVVLNARRDAIQLLTPLDQEPDVFHLSGLLCGIHRRRILAEVKRRLRDDAPVRLVSTQVVEAGVDLDFPVVYRAVGPLDRIVQAAGRCNREGSRPRGWVVIFDPVEGRAPRGPYKVGLEKARMLLWEESAEALHNPDFYRKYFRRLFSDVDLDQKCIQKHREELNYPEVAKRYRLIEEDTVPVVVPYEDAEDRLEDWQKNPSQHTWQRLQPYVVNLYRCDVNRLKDKGSLECVREGLYRWLGCYDERLGLVEAEQDPSDLIV